MRADFQQVVFDAKFNAVQQASGTLAMQRPGKFRWDYTMPYKQLIVADGIRLWVYDKDLEQVTVRFLDAALGNTPALLLSGGQFPAKSFAITELKSKGDDLYWLELVPTDQQASFTGVRLAFNSRHLAVMELLDGFGQTTRLNFTNMQYNPRIEPTVFRFTPPPDVDVIGEGAYQSE